MTIKLHTSFRFRVTGLLTCQRMCPFAFFTRHPNSQVE